MENACTPSPSNDGRWSGRVWASLRAGVGWMLAAVGLYAVFFVLQLLELGSRTAGSRLRVEAVEGTRVSGFAPPGAQIEVTEGSRTLGLGFAGLNGKFSVELQEPPGTVRTRLVARDLLATQRKDEIALPLAQVQRAAAPRDARAVFIPELKLLWVYAQLAPRQAVMMPAGSDANRGNIPQVPGTPDAITRNADDSGILEELIPFDAAPPSGFELKPQSDDVIAAPERGPNGEERQPGGVSGAGVKIEVKTIPLEKLQLSRKLDLRIADGSVRMTAEITLPPDHPRVRAIMRGVVENREFIDATFGVWPGISLDDLPVVQLGPDRAVVRLVWAEPLGSFALQAGGFNGLGREPLLTAKDEIMLHFGKERPAWFNDPLPSEITEDAARWVGPMPAGNRAFVARFGYPQTDRRAAPPPREDPAEQTTATQIVQFLARVESSATSGLFGRAWRALLGAIPFLGVAWFAMRAPFRGRPGCHSLAALACIFALLQSWSFWLSLALHGPGMWLNRSIIPLLYVLQPRGVFPESLFRGLQDTAENAFWFIFVSFTALSVAIHGRVEESLHAGQFAPVAAKAPRRWMRVLFGIGRFIRAAWVTVMLAAVVVATFIVAPVGPQSAHIREVLKLAPDFERTPIALLPIALLCVLLFAFGVRAAVFGLSLLALFTFWLVRNQPDSFRALTAAFDSPEEIGTALTTLAHCPSWLMVALVTLVAVPLVVMLMRRVFLLASAPARVGTLAIATVAVAVIGHLLPSKVLLLAASAVGVMAVGWMIVRWLARYSAGASLANWLHSRPRVCLAGLAAAGVVLGAPFSPSESTVAFSRIVALVAQLDNLLIYTLAGCTLLLLWKDARSGAPVIEPSVLAFGGFFFAAFVINSSATWFFIPVPFLVALLIARLWLFKPAAQIDQLRAVLATTLDRRALIQDALDAERANSQFESIRKALNAKYDKAELPPAKYDETLEAYRTHLHDKLEWEQIEGVSSRSAVFALGGADRRENSRAAAGFGALLGLFPFAIALYEYLPQSRVNFPYPIADLAVFMVSAIATWMLPAIFFGYFFVHLRGESGLAKGIHLSLCIALPFAALRLLNVQTLPDLQPFLLWFAQLFLFCSFLGLAMDLRLLRKHGFAPRDLTGIHNIPALSAYASTVLAATIPAVLALVSGRLTDMVTFFLKTILPAAPQ